MKKRLLALLCALALVATLLPTAALADYDIYVAAKDNIGLNMREGPGTNYPTVLPDPIPMGTKLRITQETTGSDGLTWGYTTYAGTTGWVCLKETTRAGVPEIAASNADAQAYLDILNSYSYTNSYLVDFDGDGRAELLTTRTAGPDYGSDFSMYSVWQGSTALIQDAEMEAAMMPECSLHTKDGKVYLCSSNGITFTSYHDFYTVKNGTWVQAAYFQDTEDPEGGEISLTIDSVSVSQSEYDRKLASYAKILDLHPWADPQPHDARPQLESQVSAALEIAASNADVRAYLDILNTYPYDYSYLIDFDGDGRAELLTTHSPDDDYSEAHYSIWQGSTALIQNGSMGIVVSPSCSLHTKDGKAYLCFSNIYQYGSFSSFYTIINGAWEEAAYFSHGGGPEIDDVITYSVDSVSVSQSEHDRKLASYQKLLDLHPWDNPQPHDVRPQLESQAAATSTPADILAQIPYYGDVSKCRLTSAQATEMANYLDSWSPSMKSDNRADFRALLVDTDASGYPILFLKTDSAWVLCAWQNGILTQIYYDGINRGGFDGLHLYQNAQGQYKWVAEEGCMEYYELIAYEIQKGVFLGERSNYSTANAILDEDGALVEFGPHIETRHEVDMEGFERIEENKAGIPLSSLSSLLRAYAAANTLPSYPLFADILGSGWETEPVKVASAAVPGQVAACYSLTDGMCYILIDAGDGHYQGVLLQARRQNGKVTWQVVRTDAEPAQEADLSAFVNRFLTTPNITPDFNKLRENLSAQELADYLKSLLADMTGKGPNDPAKSDLAAFIESSVAGLASGSVSGRDNRLTVDDRTVAALVEQGLDAQKQFTQVLDDNDVALGKAVTVLVRLLWQDSKLAQPCQVTFDPKLADALQGCTLQLLLGDNQHYIQLPSDRLKTLIDRYGTVTVQIKQENDLYQVTFVDQNGAVINRLPVPVTLGLPASGVLDTVMVSYSGGSDNWGGQYDPAAQIISFDATFSGQYEVLENNVAINDIGNLSEESQAAIRFMVSRGYLDAANGQFRPGDSLNRYEFTQALVGMFFALDRELTTTFPDVPSGSPYYPYVASAQAKDIVKGYADGTFSGQDPINREQVFALAARTLMDQKGYTTPADPDDYLSGFGDQAMISDWAREQLALAVREGVASRGPVILPQDNITREQAAVVLYRLFLLLYEVPPVALELPQAAAQQTLTVAIVVAAVVAVAALTAAAILLKKSKKAPK